MTIREIGKKEIAFLKEMLYLALYVHEGEPIFPRSILDHPDLSKYIEDWGSLPHDLALVAENNDELVGAIWGRGFQKPKVGWGFIDENIPEISIAVKVGFRNQGIGTKLIQEISDRYFDKGIESISLSVDKRNKARFLYERTGFVIVKDTGPDYLMKKEL